MKMHTEAKVLGIPHEVPMSLESGAKWNCLFPLEMGFKFDPGTRKNRCHLGVPSSAYSLLFNALQFNNATLFVNYVI